MSVTRINPALECQGAQVRAQCRQLATVVTVTGRIDTDNMYLVRDRVAPFVLAEKPFVLDVTGVESFAEEAVTLLRTLDSVCDGEGVEWCLILSSRVADALHDAHADAAFPIANSVPEALRSFADAVNARRRLLPILTRTA